MAEAGAEQLLRRGTVRFPQPLPITATATVCGRMEAEGPLAECFDVRVPDELWGEKTWERAEVKMFREAVRLALAKGSCTPEEVDFLVGGDLLDQLATANFAARSFPLAFLGLFSACATSGESLIVAALLLAARAAERVVAATASHNLTAERQYRYPVELGNQRRLTQQWTATGAAAFLVGGQVSGQAPAIRAATVGRVTDFGVKDVNNMGAAMAPAAADTIVRHLEATGDALEDYDLILTGDLGVVGSQLLGQLLAEHGLHLGAKHQDCGLLLYDRARQDVHAGGSGAACSALVLAGPFYRRLATGELRRLLFVPTGSLHSVTSFQQGESIPAIAHAVAIEGVGGG
jgi:stage V sporulation protein AD